MPQSGLGSTLSTARAKGHLLRILGVGFGIAVIVGDTIGSGILRTPGEVASRLGSSGFILAVWIIGGVYAFLCTLSVTELWSDASEGGWVVRVFAPCFWRVRRILGGMQRLGYANGCDGVLGSGVWRIRG